ncbi:hypothetical protein EG333_10235 [Pectobacterium versatile]|nr:hypothetical protein EG333_10235 [Pectobacterium versatile]
MGRLKRRSPHDPRLLAKLCRYAVPSAFMTTFRADGDALPARHRLSRRPCRSLGAHSHRCIIFTPDNVNPIIICAFMYKTKGASTTL